MPDQTNLAPNLADAVEFAENPEPRCPCVLLVDTSGSMQGAPIAALNEGLRAFKTDLMKDALASRRVEVAIVTFSSDVSVVGAGVRAVVSFASSPTPPPVVCSSSCSHCLSYRGGPVLTHAQVVPVYWSSGVTFQGQLNAFYSDVFQSSWFGNLAQYNVLSGTRGAPVVASLALGAYSDAQIQGQLRAMITAGTVPAPSGSTYYPIHFPAGVSIQAGDGTRSCVQWCAYHGTFVHNGVHVQYGIVPDQGGSCAGGCGGNAQLVNNLISVSSHELVETLTDPAVGLAVTLNDGNLAWYNNQFGEIGDICNAQQTTITAAGGASYVVQKEWSNCAQACV